MPGFSPALFCRRLYIPGVSESWLPLTTSWANTQLPSKGMPGIEFENGVGENFIFFLLSGAICVPLRKNTTTLYEENCMFFKNFSSIQRIERLSFCLFFFFFFKQEISLLTLKSTGMK